ncbi:MAG: glycosyltransferase family 2 protein [Planctomycetes bacterium]|nr:glycosyltransferase family 2 protein [Planctomycetota bacterium]
MTQFRASIIVCVYNRGARALECLESLLRLEDGGFEIVLVDDASTDDTPEQLARFHLAHPQCVINILRLESNRGVSGARNAGVQVARGEFVLFTDSDCTVYPGWLRGMLGAFTAPEVAAVAGAVVNPAPRNWAERAYVGTSRIHRSNLQQRRLTGCNMAFRRGVLLEHPFDPALTYYCDEDDVAQRLLRAGYRIGFAPDATVEHRHAVTFRSYLRQGYRQGRGAARFWYKHGAYLGRDLWPAAAAMATLPLPAWDARLVPLPVVLAIAQLAAIAYNERVLKGKSWVEVVIVLPVGAAYYLCKLCGAAVTYARLALGGEPGIRASKRDMKNRAAGADTRPTL